MKRLCLCVAVMVSFGGPGFANPEAMRALNDLRASKGVAPVVYSAKLEAAAQAHALDMAKHGYFAHEGRNGSSVGDRVKKQGFKWCFVAENLAKGQRDLNQVMQAWATSPGHYANLIHKKARALGLVEGPDRIWAMVLAAPC
ncbi:CAP domain-containing protein [Roseobacter sp. GAI101]|uniref:CAP domain-containing protein n=1 Tax=Roseobacter sp. (strain GAI101) TaxID=391589 RepID=UPI0003246930|nr:CAP domain-containing protein [Roseobacter sp. GAI101]